MKNVGLDPAIIQELKDECAAAEQDFMYIDTDEMDESIADDLVHVEFVGIYKGKEVIYDAIIYTLRMLHSGMVYEEAEKRVMKMFPLYVPLENRDETYQDDESVDEEVELMITEVMEEIEENEEIKILEHVEIDDEAEYGIGLDVALNVEEITHEVVVNFVENFKNNTLKLDPTLYAFRHEEDEE